MGLKKHTAKHGFTIVELLIVIVIIAILATIIIIAYTGIQARAQTAVLQGDLTNDVQSLSQSRITSSNGQYPSDLASANLKAGNNVTYQYTYTAADDAYCLTATSGSIAYMVSSSNSVPTNGVCPGQTAPGGSGLPAGYESAPLASGASSSFSGYSPIEPSTCPSAGGSWIKVPGNSLYNQTNGFCVQQYAAVNVSGVATSQNTGNKWTSITQPAAVTAAAAITSGSHLLSEYEWMTIAANAAAQPQNWGGGSVGSGSLPIGSSTATYGGVSLLLSNGQTIYFDTSALSYYASNEWTCYTGPSANNCGLAAGSQPVPANAFYTDQFNLFTSYGAFTTNGSGYYYGDPRYANSALGAYVNSSRNAGLGYLRSSYSSGSSTVFAFSRGNWIGATSSGIFTLYIYTTQTYAQATFGFRAAF